MLFFGKLELIYVSFVFLIRISLNNGSSRNNCPAPFPEHDRFTCYPPSIRHASYIHCPPLHCTGYEDTSLFEGDCCRDDVEGKAWTLCRRNTRFVASFLGSSETKTKLRKCIKTVCYLKEGSKMELLNPNTCCLYAAMDQEFTCCSGMDRTGKGALECKPFPMVMPDVHKCEHVRCNSDTGDCGPVTCCEHFNTYGKSVCCYQKESFVKQPKIHSNFNEEEGKEIGTKLGNMMCYNSSSVPPNFLQCPKFTCSGAISGGYNSLKYRCCTFDALGISWVCCNNSGCSKSFAVVSLPKCREVKCGVLKSSIEDWLGKDCCEDNTGPKPLTCCFENYMGNKRMIHCFPKAIKKPAVLRCSDLESDPVRNCQISIFKKKLCCQKSATKTCCTED